MDHEVLRLRAAIRRYQHGRPPRAVRYPTAVRRTVTALARRRRREGAHVKTIAHEVGVAPWTLALWLRTPASATLRAVDVVPDVPAASAPVHLRPVLITPQGLRVEGLDPDTLVAVLRALG
jgi:hypothetical protein